MKHVTSLDFCPVLEGLWHAEEWTGRTGMVFTQVARSTRNNLILLYNLCRALKPRRTLEVGLASGASALALTASFEAEGAEPEGQHIAIDPFQLSAEEGFDALGLKMLDEAGRSGYLTFFPERSAIVLPRLVAEGVRIDLAYIDGSHLFEDVFIDFYYLYRLLPKGGLLCFDDCVFPDVRKVLRFIERNFRGFLAPFDVSPFRADRGGSLKYRLAKRLGRIQFRAFQRIGPPERPFRAPFKDF